MSPETTSHKQRLEREREEHDLIATTLDPARLPVSLPGPLESATFDAAGIRPGMRVLDLGCGSGDLSLQLISRGAHVTGVDLSPGMVEVARRRAELVFPAANATFIAAPVERTGLESNSFDAIVGRFILHHLDLELCLAEIARVLAPGGRVSFAENSGRNAVLMFARSRVVGRFGVIRLGTVDEKPLDSSDIALIGRHFDSTLATYPVFDFFRIFDRQVFRFRYRRASMLCTRLDTFVERHVPLLRPYSFRVVVTAGKEH